MGKVQVGFGGSYRTPTPHRLHMVKMQWIVGGMFMLIVLLISGVFFLARDMEESPQVAQAAVIPPPPPPPEIPTQRILVPVNNIDEGTELTQSLFVEKRIPEEFAPTGILTTDDVLKLEGKFARDNLLAGTLVPVTSLSNERPVTAFHIPAGYRAVTISADKRTSVEGFVKPGSLVDVLWVYQDETENGRKRIATIVRFVRVLSVAGDTFTGTDRARVQQDSFTVSVLATEKDAKVIQLAAAMGQVTLSLVGDNENNLVGPVQSDTTDIVSLADVLKRDKVVERPKVTSKDPITGKAQNYVFRDGDWVLAEEPKK